MQPADALESGEQFFLDTFALRQWDDPDYAGTRIEFEKAEFVARIHEYFEKGCPLVDGYAPFCKHLFVPNFVGAKQAHVEITNANRSQLRCAYTRRRPEELGVLMRWFPADAVEVGEAKMLDIILYSRAQIEKERAALPAADPLPELPDAPWGIISVKAQDEEHETPMLPITMMRNALGRSEGGSGVPLQRDKYEEATQYWMRYATVMPADYDPEAELELEAFPDEEGLETVDEAGSAAAAADAGEGVDGQPPPKIRPPAGA